MAAKTTDPIDILLEMGIDLDNLSEEEDYLSALMEAANTLTIKNPEDPRIGPLVEEIVKVRKKRFSKARPEVKRTTINPDKFFDRKKISEREAKQTPGQLMLPGNVSGALVGPDSLRLPEGEESVREVKNKPDILQDILSGVNSILETLKAQNKLGKKKEEKNRKKAEKLKRSDKEDKLEKGPLEKFVNQSKKLLKPVRNLFDGLFKFIYNVLIGRFLIKAIKWFSDPKNAEKLKAIGEFFKATWPALLAAFVAFKLKFGGFVGLLIKTVSGFIPKLLGLIPKIFKGAVGLAKLAIANPIAASVVGGTVLAALGAVALSKSGSATVKDLDNPEKSQMDEINESGGMIGAPMSGDMFDDSSQMKGGGLIPGSGPNKDTIPAMLAPGEFVISRGAVQKYGSDTFAAMNAAGGGTNLPERMNGITYAVRGGLMGDYEEKNEKQSPAVESEMQKRRKYRRSSGGAPAKQPSESGGGMFGGIKKLFGGGEDKKKSEKQLSAEKANAELLSFISKGEGGYNSMNQGTSGGGIVGSTHNASTILGKNLTDMTVREIIEHQSSGRLFAAGRYQIIPSTMQMAVSRAGVSPDDMFDTKTQDKLGLALIYNGQRPNLSAYLKGDSNNLHAAMKDLAMEWASAPDPDTGASYYPPANKSSHTVEEVKSALMSARSQGAGNFMTASAASSVDLTPSSSGSSGSVSSEPHTKTLSGIVGGVETQMQNALRGSGSGSIIKRKPSSGSSIEPPVTTTLSTIARRTGMSGSSLNQSSPTRPADPSPPNNIPPIDADAMISQEKIKVLGITVG